MAEQAEHIVIVCGQCGQKMKAPAQAQGKTFKCIKCAAPVRVPTHEPIKPPVPEAAAPKPAAPTAEAPAGRIPLNPVARGKIGELLIEQGLITEEQLQLALCHQAQHGGRTFQILIELGHLNKEALHDCLSKQPRVAAIDLKKYRLDNALLDLVPRELAHDRCVLPTDRLGKMLTVAMACPMDTATIEEIEQHTGLRVRAMLAKLDDIVAAIEKYYPEAKEPKVDDSYFRNLFGPTAKLQQEDERPVQTAPAPAAAPPTAPAATPAPEPVVAPAPPPPPPAPETPLTQERVDALLDLADDDSVGIDEVLRRVEECPPLARAIMAIVNSDAYEIWGPQANLASAIAMLDKSGVAALADLLCSGALEV